MNSLVVILHTMLDKPRSLVDTSSSKIFTDMATSFDPSLLGMAPRTIGEIIPAFQAVARLEDYAVGLTMSAEEAEGSVNGVLTDRLEAYTPGMDPTVNLDKLDEETRLGLLVNAETVAVHGFLAKRLRAQQIALSRVYAQSISRHLGGSMVVVEAVTPGDTPIDVLDPKPARSGAPGSEKAGIVTGRIESANPKSGLLTLSRAEREKVPGRVAGYYVAHILPERIKDEPPTEISRVPLVSLSLVEIAE